MHLLEKILVIHILVSYASAETVILADSLTKRQTSEVGIENATSRHKDQGS
jgi:hypothetical protein